VTYTTFNIGTLENGNLQLGDSAKYEAFQKKYLSCHSC